VKRPLLTSTTLVLSLSLASVGCNKKGEVSVAPVTETEADANDEAASSSDESSEFDRVAEADRLSARARELFDVPGMAVAVVVGEEVVFAKGYGEIEKGKGRAVDPRTSFAIASNTKAFTATAVGLLVAEGVISWDDRVVDHLPELELWDPYVTRELRVRDLLSHRVGLATWAGDLMWLSSNYDRKTIMARLKHLPTDYGFRERYGYCNLMFMVAGELIERKTGKTWDGFIQERIFQPLGMQSVATRVGQLEGRDNVAKPHILVDGQWETTPYLDLAAVGPAASFHANVEDLSRWMQMQLADGSFGGKEVIPKSVIRETRQPHMWLRVAEEDFLEPSRHLLGYGLGWYLADYRGELLVTHGGGMPGMTSRVLMFPESKVGVVVLTSSETGVSSALAHALADLWLTSASESRKDYVAASHERAEKAKAEAKDGASAKLEGDAPPELLGKWKNPLLGKGVVSKTDDGYWFEIPDHGGMKCRLYAATENDDAGRATQVPCKWTDPNMGVSSFRLERKGKKVRSMSFKVRPDFYDPLEYSYTR
jgi:CubicO group peptidase (beta-lactamase class C family)